MKNESIKARNLFHYTMLTCDAVDILVDNFNLDFAKLDEKTIKRLDLIIFAVCMDGNGRDANAIYDRIEACIPGFFAKYTRKTPAFKPGNKINVLYKYRDFAYIATVTRCTAHTVWYEFDHKPAVYVDTKARWHKSEMIDRGGYFETADGDYIIFAY